MDKFKIIIETGNAETGITRRTVDFENLTEAIERFCHAISLFDQSQITLVRVKPLRNSASVQ